MSCARCEPYTGTIAIHSPRDLTDAIRHAQQGVEQGDLVEIVNEAWTTMSILQLKPEGPWADSEWWELECADCRQKFRLEAETYRGRGGKWHALIGGSLPT